MKNTSDNPTSVKNVFGKKINIRTAIVISVAIVLMAVIGLFFWQSITQTKGRSPNVIIPPNASTAPATVAVSNTPKPDATSSSPRPSKYNNKYLSEEVIDLARNLLSKHESFKLFRDYQVGKAITAKTRGSYIFGNTENSFLDAVFNNSAVRICSVVKLVDIDNDGQDEVAVYKNSGKKDYHMSLSVMKKDTAGTYVFSEFPGNMAQFDTLSTNAFIKVKGKIFFATERVNRSTLKVQGVNLYSINSGNVVERAFIAKAASKSIFLKKGLKKIFQSVENGKDFLGSAEKVVPISNALQLDQFLHGASWTQVDINNDGKLEFVGKLIENYMKVVAYGSDKGQYYKIDLAKLYLNSAKSIFQLWFDKSAEGNKLLVLTKRKNQFSYDIKAFQTNPSKTVLVSQKNVNYQVNLGVRIWTGGVNAKFVHATQYIAPTAAASAAPSSIPVVY